MVKVKQHKRKIPRGYFKLDESGDLEDIKYWARRTQQDGYKTKIIKRADGRYSLYSDFWRKC